MTTAREAIKLVAPPILTQLARRLRSSAPTRVYGLSGDYQNWSEALAASTGYDDQVILDKTRRAIAAVKNGHAIYERDSVLFAEIDYAWAPLAGLMWAAARREGALNVLDFGGSLGSTYFQNRAFLSALPRVRWNIVEQPGYVEIGKAEFEDDRLRFYASITECVAETRPDVVLLSSVLQYLERPYTVFEELMALPSDLIIIDRTPFWDGPSDRLCVQTVPPSIYPGSYPSWIFSRGQFQARLSDFWGCAATFQSLDKLPGPVDLVYQGALLARRGSWSCDETSGIQTTGHQ